MRSDVVQSTFSLDVYPVICCVTYGLCGGVNDQMCKIRFLCIRSDVV